MEFPQVGGSREAFLAAKSLFLSMGKSTIYCGEAGSGSVSNRVKIGIELLVLLITYML
jgi:3-hydroxyisobutyrate dehydrogenase-like beta-hydroxyacid dehydrogenase